MWVSQTFPEVEQLSGEADKDGLVALFDEYFIQNTDEIQAAIAGKWFPEYDYRQRVLLGIRTKDPQPESDGGQIDSACIVVEKMVKTHRVFEVVWLATSAAVAKKGAGSKVFSGVLEYAKEKNASAVLVTSTNRALSWWVSRKRGNLAKYIIRGKTRSDIKSTRLASDPSEHERNAQVLKGTLQSLGVQTQPYPTHSLMESLYGESINRNRKGKPATVQTFRGLPYRYDIDQSNHVWFLISKHLIKYLSCPDR